ncbi:MAG: hypothetical protein IH940_03835 [Acidobacteria bacterium]|nr:hypothetical protein [Acidobacteriota bacterium]
MTSRELILYATPTGALAAACEQYFAAVDDVGATTAQAYPPHCTLTGFFHRSESRATQVIADLTAEICQAGRPPSGLVRIAGLRAIDGWVGLTLESPWLIELTESVITGQELAAGDDPLRPKDWLHLSLAYEVDDTAPYLALADHIVGTEAGDDLGNFSWEVAIWERIEPGRFLRH